MQYMADTIEVLLQLTVLYRAKSQAFVNISLQAPLGDPRIEPWEMCHRDYHG
eukprot:m.489330 g.489330  ORF g.489330 m.489330 type:complete len:52 (+) comp21765_c0_seq1:564-719(+)